MSGRNPHRAGDAPVTIPRKKNENPAVAVIVTTTAVNRTPNPSAGGKTTRKAVTKPLVTS
jgi:hypothetical protein